MPERGEPTTNTGRSPGRSRWTASPFPAAHGDPRHRGRVQRRRRDGLPDGVNEFERFVHERLILYGALAGTHTSGRLADLPAGAGRYAGHSEGHVRRAFIDRAAGSMHQEVVDRRARARAAASSGTCTPSRRRSTCSRAGSTFEAAGATEELAADDFVFVERGVAHELRNDGAEPARWLEVSAPQPGAAHRGHGLRHRQRAARSWRPPIERATSIPRSCPRRAPGSALPGFGGGNVGGAAAKVIVGPDFGASQLNLMVVQYAPGGFITVHDHAFEEGFFFLTGQIEAELEGETHALEAGDYCWSAVGSMHALRNTSDAAGALARDPGAPAAVAPPGPLLRRLGALPRRRVVTARTPSV